ncbi:MAG: alpha/beta hydrolase, partial [Oscillospiraceae bacterium]|nr:alpha/beta hydrolase [Oscillospiraceae bacterium]
MEHYNIHQPIRFTSGMYDLNDEPNFNYQLCRVIHWNGGTLEDVQRVGKSIHSSADWKRTLISLGNRAEKENRIAPAIGYYRMSEFFMEDSDPDKLKYYQRATDMFYEYYRDYFAGEVPVIERHSVPYEGIGLPVWHLRPEGEPKDTI